MNTLEADRYAVKKKKPSKTARTKSSYVSSGLGRTSASSALRGDDESDVTPNYKKGKKKIQAPNTVDQSLGRKGRKMLKSMKFRNGVIPS